MSKIKSAKLLVDLRGFVSGEPLELRKGFGWVARTSVYPYCFAEDEKGLRVLARHGIVAIEEEQERSCETCGNTCEFPEIGKVCIGWQPRPDPVDSKPIMVDAHPLDCMCSKCFDKGINGHSRITGEQYKPAATVETARRSLSDPMHEELLSRIERLERQMGEKGGEG